MSTPTKSPGDWQDLDNETQAPRYRAISRHIPAASRVLDVGCGSGVLRRYLPDVYYSGIEPNREARIAAVKNGLWCLISSDDPDQFVYPGPWDRIVMSETLYYSSHPVTQLARHFVTLEPAGRLIITIWMRPKLPGVRKALRCLLDHKRPMSNLHCAEMVERWIDGNAVLETCEDIPHPASPFPWRLWVIRRP